MRHRLRRVLLFGPTNPEIVKCPYIVWRLLKDRFEVRDRTFEMRLLHTNIAQRKISGGGARVQTKRSCERQGRGARLIQSTQRQT